MSVLAWVEREVVQEGPDPDGVRNLVKELVAELNQADGDNPATVRAGMAPLNLVMVHLFKDGNGRLARASRC